MAFANFADAVCSTSPFVAPQALTPTPHRRPQMRPSIIVNKNRVQSLVRDHASPNLPLLDYTHFVRSLLPFCLRSLPGVYHTCLLYILLHPASARHRNRSLVPPALLSRAHCLSPQVLRPLQTRKRAVGATRAQHGLDRYVSPRVPSRTPPLVQPRARSHFGDVARFISSYHFRTRTRSLPPSFRAFRERHVDRDVVTGTQ